jgi:DNA invertase Pin-like site-specific DNA recombinase
MIFEFDSNGVALICTSQPIDTSEENPAGRLIMHVLIAMAEFERSLIKERTRAGLRVAKARGVKFGRPVRPVTQKCKGLSNLSAREIFALTESWPKHSIARSAGLMR